MHSFVIYILKGKGFDSRYCRGLFLTDGELLNITPSLEQEAEQNMNTKLVKSFHNVAKVENFETLETNSNSSVRNQENNEFWISLLPNRSGFFFVSLWYMW